MELPPPPVPVPGPAENLLSVLSDHAGLLAGCALAITLAFGVARQRKLIATKSNGQTFAGSAS